MKSRLVLTALTLACTSVLNLRDPANAQSPVPANGKKPNILIIWGDDIGIANVSAYSDGLMGYETPNIDRIGKEGRHLQVRGDVQRLSAPLFPAVVQPSERHGGYAPRHQSQEEAGGGVPNAPRGSA
jgi:hypothetical protein